VAELADLDDVQEAALQRLVALVTEATTEIVRVHMEVEDNINEMPALVLQDEGMWDERIGGGESDVSWDIRMKVFLQRSDLGEAHAKARRIRAKLISRLATDITLAGNADRTMWEEPIAIDRSDEYAGTPYLVINGLYRVYLKLTVTYT
jgi:hypothetical protein